MRTLNIKHQTPAPRLCESFGRPETNNESTKNESTNNESTNNESTPPYVFRFFFLAAGNSTLFRMRR